MLCIKRRVSFCLCPNTYKNFNIIKKSKLNRNRNLKRKFIAIKNYELRQTIGKIKIDAQFCLF